MHRINVNRVHYSITSQYLPHIRNYTFTEMLMFLGSDVMCRGQTQVKGGSEDQRNREDIEQGN